MSSEWFAARMKAASRAITESAVCSPSARKKTERLSTRDKAVTELEERTFDGKEQNSRGDKDGKLNANERDRCIQKDAVAGEELFDEMDNQFLDEVGAVGNAGDESSARNSDPMKRQ